MENTNFTKNKNEKNSFTFLNLTIEREDVKMMHKIERYWSEFFKAVNLWCGKETKGQLFLPGNLALPGFSKEDFYAMFDFFLALLNPCVRLSFTGCDKKDNIYHKDLFYRALTASLINFKRHLIQALQKNHYTIRDMAQTILKDLDEQDEKNKEIDRLAEDIKKYNKHQLRIYYNHTRKSCSNFRNMIFSEGYNSNIGDFLVVERSICEIEYFLKKMSRHNTDAEIQKYVDEYALGKIHQLFEWQELRLEELNELRKTYSKLRPFFINGEWKSGKIPDYCYDNYLECFHLIYDYVTAYTPSGLRDTAYYMLDNRYSLYSYFCIVFLHCSVHLNDMTMPENDLYKYYKTQCDNGLKKITLYNVYRSPLEKENENNLDRLIIVYTLASDILSHQFYKKSYDTPFPAICSRFNTPSLDELLVCNILWNNEMVISQSEFIEELSARARSKDSIIEVIQISMNLIEAVLENNKNMYDNAIEQMLVKLHSVDASSIIQELLKSKIFSELVCEIFRLILQLTKINTENDKSMYKKIKKQIHKTSLKIDSKTVKGIAEEVSSMRISFGMLQLSFELIGVDIEKNKAQFNDLLRLICSKSHDINPETVINRVLKMIYKDQCFLENDFYNKESYNEKDDFKGLNEEEQKAVLKFFYKKIDTYIKNAAERRDNNSWKKGIIPNLIYQFFYRNKFQFGMPGIFPNDVTRNFYFVNRFLGRYNMEMTRDITPQNCLLLKNCLERVKKDSEVYERLKNLMEKYKNISFGI